jgi:hypothetical protein
MRIPIGFGVKPKATIDQTAGVSKQTPAAKSLHVGIEGAVANREMGDAWQRFNPADAPAQTRDQNCVRSLGIASGAPIAAAIDRREARNDWDAAARNHFGEMDIHAYGAFDGMALDDRDPAVMAGVPDAVKQSLAYYTTNAEDNDWGTAHLVKAQVEGDDVWAVITTTDGDDGYLEVFDGAGRELGSALKMDGDPAQWDAEFGAVRAQLIDY